jgi:hypothetical protein
LGQERNRIVEKYLLPRGYSTLLRDIKERIRSAQYAALKTVNREMIALYWDIGQIIVERIQYPLKLSQIRYSIFVAESSVKPLFSGTLRG